MAAQGRPLPRGREAASLQKHANRWDEAFLGAFEPADLGRLVSRLPGLDRGQLRLQWRNHLGGTPPAHLPTCLLMRVLAYRLQAACFGDLKPATIRKLEGADADDRRASAFANRSPTTRKGADLKPGSILAREWRGRLERVTVLKDGFAWNGTTYGSVSMVARAITGTSWNGHRFFGLRSGQAARPNGGAGDDAVGKSP